MIVDRTLTERRPGDPVSMQPGHSDTLLNPTLLIEVLSRSTERYDRGAKAEHYRRLDSLQELLLIVQAKPQVERYRRHGNHDRLLTEFRGFEDSVELTGVGCTLAIRNIYVGVPLA